MINPMNSIHNHKPLAKSSSLEILTELARRLEASTDGTGPSLADFARLWDCDIKDLQRKAGDWQNLTVNQISATLVADEQARPDRGRAFVKPKKGR